MWQIVAITSVIVSIILLVYAVGQSAIIDDQELLLDNIDEFCNADTYRMLLNTCDTYYKELAGDYKKCKAMAINVTVENNRPPIITEINSTIYTCEGR